MGGWGRAQRSPRTQRHWGVADSAPATPIKNCTTPTRKVVRRTLRRLSPIITNLRPRAPSRTPAGPPPLIAYNYQLRTARPFANASETWLAGRGSIVRAFSARFQRLGVWWNDSARALSHKINAMDDVADSPLPERRRDTGCRQRH